MQQTNEMLKKTYAGLEFYADEKMAYAIMESKYHSESYTENYIKDVHAGIITIANDKYAEIQALATYEIRDKNGNLIIENLAGLSTYVDEKIASNELIAKLNTPNAKGETLFQTIVDETKSSAVLTQKFIAKDRYGNILYDSAGNPIFNESAFQTLVSDNSIVKTMKDKFTYYDPTTGNYTFYNAAFNQAIAESNVVSTLARQFLTSSNKYNFITGQIEKIYTFSEQYFNTLVNENENIKSYIETFETIDPKTGLTLTESIAQIMQVLDEQQAGGEVSYETLNALAYISVIASDRYQSNEGIILHSDRAEGGSQLTVSRNEITLSTSSPINLWANEVYIGYPTRGGGFGDIYLRGNLYWDGGYTGVYRDYIKLGWKTLYVDGNEMHVLGME